MKNLKFYKLWKIFLIPIYIFIFTHFVKDITQDILQISTILDKFGNIQEDLSSFPENLTWFYHWFLVNTFFLEIYLIFAIPKVWKQKSYSKIDLFVITSILYILVAFLIAFLLDPKNIK